MKFETLGAVVQLKFYFLTKLLVIKNWISVQQLIFVRKKVKLFPGKLARLTIQTYKGLAANFPPKMRI